MNKDDYSKNYANEKRKKPSIIDQIEADIVSVLNKDRLGYHGGTGGGEGKGARCTTKEN